MNSVYASLGATIFEQMSRLAAERGAVNLGQGFPEQDGPLDLREFAARATIDGPNQYPPMRGVPKLREAVARHYNDWHHLSLDWRTEVTVTSGATEAIAAALLAFIEPGDEVVLFEPLYDAYLPLVLRAGGVPRIVRLQPPLWRYDQISLADAFSDRTRLVVINTPLNPAGNLMSRDELALVASFCVNHDCILVSDEVWEHVVFDGAQHVSALSVLRDRTLKIGSAGKMFSLTGWKVGFACGAPNLTEQFAKAHQFLTFTTPPNLQRAAAFGLSKPRKYFEEMCNGLQRSRDRLLSSLRREGFVVTPGAGTYFVTVDLPASGIGMNDAEFAKHAIDHGVAVIPYAPFYSSQPAPALIRLCFAKSDETLDRGAEALARAKRNS